VAIPVLQIPSVDDLTSGRARIRVSKVPPHPHGAWGDLLPAPLSGRGCGGCGVEAGNLVKAVREWFWLQLVRVLMASGAFSCRWPRAWFGRGALPVSRASADFLGRLGSVRIARSTLSTHFRADSWRRPLVQVYY